jgi:hypothetical protein
MPKSSANCAFGVGPALDRRRLVGSRTSCDSPPVSIGSGTIALALVVAVGFAGSAATESPGKPVAAQPLAKKDKKKRTKLVFFKARVASDGLLTPGRPETVGVSHMPRRTGFKVAIEPPPTTIQCGQLYFCDVAPVSPAPGGPPFMTDGKGEAVVTFVMPSTYNIATDPFDPSTRRPVTWADGQRVHIDVEGVKRKHGVKKLGFGFGRAAVEVPAQ